MDVSNRAVAYSPLMVSIRRSFETLSTIFMRGTRLPKDWFDTSRCWSGGYTQSLTVGFCPVGLVSIAHKRPSYSCSNKNKQWWYARREKRSGNGVRQQRKDNKKQTNERLWPTRCSISSFMSHDMRKIPFLALRKRTPCSIKKQKTIKKYMRKRKQTMS